MEPEEIWREVGKLSTIERQKLLLSKAKIEGEVVWYTAWALTTVDPLRVEFERRYPDIKVNIWRGRGETVSNRLLTEARGGRFSADVISGSNEYFTTIMQAALVGRYASPEREYYPSAHKDREGYWTSLGYILAVMAYNNRLVASSETPKRYEDFLDSKWNRQFAIDTAPDRTVMGWLKLWGNEKTERVLQALMRNGGAARSGHNLTVQLLCAGEFKAAIDVYVSHVLDSKQKGCPIEMVLPQPTPGAATPLYVAKRSPHPHAAALLVDHLLSDASQRIVVDKGFYSGRRGIGPKSPEADLERRGVRALILRPEDAEELGRKYTELRERYLLIR